MSPADGRCPPTPPPRCSCYQAEACCAAGSLGLCGAPWSRHIDQRQPLVAGAWHGVRCKAIHITGFGARKFMSRCSEREDSAAWNHLPGSEMEPLPVMAAGPCAGRGPTRAPDSGDDTSLRVVTPAPHHEVTTGSPRGLWVAEPLVCRSCPSFLPIVPVGSSWYLGLTTYPFACWFHPSLPIHLLTLPSSSPRRLSPPIGF